MRELVCRTWLAAPALLLLCACGASKPAADANSNWLAACSEHAGCPSGSACICGLCTRTCSDDDQCARGGVAASCVSPTPGAMQPGGCAAVVRAAGNRICLTECADDGDCGPTARCDEGACWPEAPLVVVEDAGAELHSTAASTGLDSGVRDAGFVQPTVRLAIDAGGDLSRFDASFVFDEPVTRPEPEVAIESAPGASVVGVWVQPPSDEPRLRLDIEAPPGGPTVGTVTFVCDGCHPSGPVAPAVDPELGYPVELSLEDQGLLRTNLLPEFAYRMFDGRADTDGFRFWFSNNDLWRDWCTLQTPYAVEVEGRTLFSCIAEAYPHDLIPPLDGDAKKWLCAYDNSVCSCDREACSIDPHASVHTLDLRFDGEALRGIWTTGTDTEPIRFVREIGGAR